MSFPNYFADYKTPRALVKRKKIKRVNGQMNPELMALKQAVYNPFSLAHAGIPDGKHWLSNKIKFQTVFELGFGDHGAILAPEATEFQNVTKFPRYVAKDTVDMLFFPGLNNMILVQPKTGDWYPLRYRYPDTSGSGIADPTVEGDDKDGLNSGDVNIVVDTATTARRLDANIPYPLYAHDSISCPVPVAPGTSFPDGANLSENSPRFKYHQVQGFSEVLGQATKENRIEKWRLVSAGLRISCTNNATNNTGWWEATRVNVAGNSGQWALMPLPNGINANATAPEWNTANANANELARYREFYDRWAEVTRYYITGKINQARTGFTTKAALPPFGASLPPGTTPTAAQEATVTAHTLPANRVQQIALPCVGTDEDMPNNNTYVSGKVRDLHKHVFKLRPSSDEHPYKEIPEKIRRSDYGDNWPFNDKRAAAGEGDEDAFVDDIFDAIHIRIHSSPGTQLMCHYVANQELVYDENSNFARTAERATMSASDYQIANVYNSGIPAAATTMPSSTKSRVMYYE